MPDELIDIYSEKNQEKGQQKMKSIAHKEGLRHRTVNIIIVDKNKRVLLQKRGDMKDIHPGKREMSATGHIGAGEKPIISAIRECEEETGIVFKKEDLTFIKIHKQNFVFNGLTNREFIYQYIAIVEEDVRLHITEDAVSSLKRFSREERKDIQSQKGKIIPYDEYIPGYRECMNNAIEEKLK